MSVKGYYQKRIDRLAHEFCIYDDVKDCFYTMTFTVHKKVDPTIQQPTTIVAMDSEGESLIRGIAEALTEGGFMPKSATDAELKATKYHLEDMRKLALS